MRRGAGISREMAGKTFPEIFGPVRSQGQTDERLDERNGRIDSAGGGAVRRQIL